MININMKNLTKEVIDEIIKRLSKGESYREIAKNLELIGFKTTHETVRKIAKLNFVKSKNRVVFDGWDPDILWLREWLEESSYGKSFMKYVAMNPTHVSIDHILDDSILT